MNNKIQMPKPQPAWSFESRYVIRDPEKVRRFVDQRTFLAGLLEDVADNIEKHFFAVKPSLDAVDQSGTAAEKLLVTVVAPDVAVPVMNKRERLDLEWWPAVSNRARQNIRLKLVGFPLEAIPAKSLAKSIQVEPPFSSVLGDPAIQPPQSGRPHFGAFEPIRGTGTPASDLLIQERR